ncbi:MAG: beta-propeller fold lactonase family protein [Planctomycetes bacterium]|nr:beta-propeller fold lactonase family protein [Planctomycetota bacterium]
MRKLVMAVVAAGAVGGLAANLLRSDAVAPSAPTGRPAAPVYRSPNHVCLSADGRLAYVVNHTSDTLSVLDIRGRKVVSEIAVGSRPVHAALSRDGAFLYVSCLYVGAISVVDLEKGRVVRTIATGDEPYGVTVSRDGRRLFVANSLSDTVSVIDAAAGTTLAEIPVARSPRDIAETPDGKLVVSNGLSRGMSVLDPAAGSELERRDLGRASLTRQVACTKDGRWAFVAGILSHDETPSLQMERGWIHSNGFSVADLTRPGHRVTLLLDRLLNGAANPWGLVLSTDEKRMYVSISGVHEIAIVDVAKCLQLVEETTPDLVKPMEEDVEILEKRGIARRFDAGGLGPRGIALSEATGELLVANYFSDSVTVLDAETGALRATIPLGPPQEMTLWRKGELLFNDARITYQTWFSCTSCHGEDATVDGLNWDLPNDGLGNAKSAKSLHDAYDTPPAMWSGVRVNMEAAIAAGQRFQGFLPVPENHKALVEYLGNPERAPNPYRTRNPEALQRGEAVFRAAGCDVCHPAPKFTDMKLHDLGFGTPDDYRSRFDTPSLRETLRGGPWLHDGRAPTLRSIFTDHNPKDLHGRTKGLSPQELDDLIAYLRSL